MNTNTDISQLHALDLEEAVLGAMLLERESVGLVIQILKPDNFYSEKHSEVFKAILELFKSNEPVDILLVTLKLKEKGKLEFVGGAHFVSGLTNRIASSANIEFHARIIYQKFILREIKRLGILAVKKSEELDVDSFELVDEFRKELDKLINFESQKRIKKVGEIVSEKLQNIENVINNGQQSDLIKSEFKLFDHEFGGYAKGTLNIIAARPGMGKTAFALGIAKNVAMEQNIPTVIFSLEMTSKQLVGRLMASESWYNSTKINHNTVERSSFETVKNSVVKLSNAPLFIDETPAITYFDLRNKARKLVEKEGIKLIIIDYLQLMHGEQKGNREQEVSFISRNLKALAKELDLPIIALSQLSREVEKRPDKRPQLSDIRESGSIEADADNVDFLFRPEYYGLFKEGYQYGNENLMDINELLLIDRAKARESRLGELPLRVNLGIMLITDYKLRDTKYEHIFRNDTENNQTDYKNLSANDNFLDDKPF